MQLAPRHQALKRQPRLRPAWVVVPGGDVGAEPSGRAGPKALAPPSAACRPPVAEGRRTHHAYVPPDRGGGALPRRRRRPCRRHWPPFWRFIATDPVVEDLDGATLPQPGGGGTASPAWSCTAAGSRPVRPNQRRRDRPRLPYLLVCRALLGALAIDRPGQAARRLAHHLPPIWPRLSGDRPMSATTRRTARCRPRPPFAPPSSAPPGAGFPRTGRSAVLPLYAGRHQ